MFIDWRPEQICAVLRNEIFCLDLLTLACFKLSLKRVLIRVGKLAETGGVPVNRGTT